MADSKLDREYQSTISILVNLRPYEFASGTIKSKTLDQGDFAVEVRFLFGAEFECDAASGGDAFERGKRRQKNQERFFDCGPARPDARDGREKSRPSAQNDGPQQRQERFFGPKCGPQNDAPVSVAAGSQ